MARAKTWHVYLLRCADGSLYCGATTDVERRIVEHREGRGSKYVRSRLPFELAAETVCRLEKGPALRIERWIKSLKKEEKLKAMEDMNTLMNTLTLGTPGNPRFGAEDAKPIIYRPVDYRVPQAGDWYVNKSGDVVRQKGRNTSRHARKKIIVVREK